MKRSEVDISLNHDIWQHFHSSSEPDFPNLGLGQSNGIRCTHIPLRQHTNGSNSLYMSNMDVWSNLRWTLASNMMLWHHFQSGANLASVTVQECNHMLLRQHTNSLNTVYMSNMDVWSGLRWIFASNMMLWHHFHFFSSEPESPYLGPTWLV
jgi:hypothetical protein